METQMANCLKSLLKPTEQDLLIAFTDFCIHYCFIVLLSILRSLSLKDVCFIIIISCEGIW